MPTTPQPCLLHLVCDVRIYTSANDSDLSVYHGLRTLQATAGRSVGLSSTINFYDIKGSVSGGTLASVAAGASKEDRKNMGEWALVARE